MFFILDRACRAVEKCDCSSLASKTLKVLDHVLSGAGFKVSV